MAGKKSDWYKLSQRELFENRNTVGTVYVLGILAFYAALVPSWFYEGDLSALVMSIILLAEIAVIHFSIITRVKLFDLKGEELAVLRRSVMRMSALVAFLPGVIAIAFLTGILSIPKTIESVLIIALWVEIYSSIMVYPAGYQRLKKTYGVLPGEILGIVFRDRKHILTEEHLRARIDQDAFRVNS